MAWCEDCAEMSWELEKARVLYKYAKREAQQFIPMSFSPPELRGSARRDQLARKHSYDPAQRSPQPFQLQGEVWCAICGVDVFQAPSVPKDRRYNIKQKKELLKVLNKCLAIVAKEEGKVDSSLNKWLFEEDIEDFRNVRARTKPIGGRTWC